LHNYGGNGLPLHNFGGANLAAHGFGGAVPSYGAGAGAVHSFAAPAIGNFGGADAHGFGARLFRLLLLQSTAEWATKTRGKRSALNSENRVPRRPARAAQKALLVFSSAAGVIARI
jgi:hypothetical protein